MYHDPHECGKRGFTMIPCLKSMIELAPVLQLSQDNDIVLHAEHSEGALPLIRHH